MNTVKTIGVVRGGSDAMYAESLTTGQSVLAHAPQGEYTMRDIFIDTGDVWHVRGMPTPPLRALTGVDVVWNALHNTPHKAGSPYHAFEASQTPFTGSDRVASALASDPVFIEKHMPNAPFRHIPRHVLRRDMCTEEKLDAIFNAILGSVVVRGARMSYHQAQVVSDVADLAHTVLFAFGDREYVVLEPYIEGRYISVFVVEGFRDEAFYAFPAIEFVSGVGDVGRVLLQSESQTQKIYPTHLSQEQTAMLGSFARSIHQKLNLRDYSRSDFVMRPDGVYLIKTHAHPSLGENTLVGHALSAVGATLSQFVAHVLQRRYRLGYNTTA